MKSSNGLLWPAVIGGLLAGVVVGVIGVMVFQSLTTPEEEAQAGGPPEQGGPPPASVRVGLVEMQTLQDRVNVIGRLREVRRVTVTAEVEGKITNLAVDEGDTVEGGTTKIAQIDEVWANLKSGPLPRMWRPLRPSWIRPTATSNSSNNCTSRLGQGQGSRRQADPRRVEPGPARCGCGPA